MERKCARPRQNSCSSREHNTCSTKCAFRKKIAIPEDKMILSLSSPVIGSSAQEFLKQYMDRTGHSVQQQADRRDASDTNQQTEIEPRSSSCLASRNGITNEGDVFLDKRQTDLKVHENINTRINTPMKKLDDVSIKMSPVKEPEKMSSSLALTRNCSTPSLPSGSPNIARKSEASRCLSSPNVTISQTYSRPETGEIQLNFNYKRHYLLPNKPVVNIEQQLTIDTKPSGHSSPASSFNETAEIIYKFKRRIKKCKDEPNFTKYIPVSLPASLHVPRLLLNKMDEGEWEMAQDAYERDRIEFLNQSGSETRINEEVNRLIPGTPNKSVRCIPIRCASKQKSTSASYSNQSIDRIFHNYVKSQNAPKRMDKRFDQDKAGNVIASNMKTNPDYKCVLYAGLLEEPNYALCHVMTELCVSAMLNYFHPYREVQCLWIPDIQAKLIDLLKDHRLKPRFTRLVYLRKFEAILVLSEDASHLLKHKDMCFLHSLTSALKIQPHKLLVLCRESNDRDRPDTA